MADDLFDEGRAEKILKKALARGADFAEIYVQRRQRFGSSLEDGDIKSASSGQSFGIGIRTVLGAKTAYAHSDDLSDAALLACADSVSYIGAASPRDPLQITRQTAASINQIAVNPRSFEISRKIDLIQEGYQSAKGLHSNIQKIFCSLADVSEDILIINSEGLWVADKRCLARYTLSVLIDDDGTTRVGSYGGGNREGLGIYAETLRPDLVAQEAVRMAAAQIGAKPCPAGKQTIVVGPRSSGVLLHEAVGHGLEADFIRKKTSLFTDKVGELVASPLVTVVDDGTVPGARGSLNVDDEGTATQKNILIENGVLKGYMSDKLNATLMGQTSSGNGRRESFRHAPVPRMTNTYMASGESDPNEILSNVKDGLYCRTFGGGQVDIANGNFVFEVREGFKIRNGELAEPIQGATLVGNGPEALSKIVAVGNDSGLDSGTYTCGKAGQSVPVTVGQPTLQLDDMTVGGTGAT